MSTSIRRPTKSHELKLGLNFATYPVISRVSFVSSSPAISCLKLDGEPGRGGGLGCAFVKTDRLLQARLLNFFSCFLFSFVQTVFKGALTLTQGLCQLGKSGGAKKQKDHDGD